jgi:hypothetical protein
MCCGSKQPVSGEKTLDPRTGCVGDYITPKTLSIHSKIVVNIFLFFMN